MPITARTVNNLGYISITVMMAMLLLLWFGIVPESFTVPFFVVALGLFLTRIVLRIKLARSERLAHKSTRQQEKQSAGVSE